MNSKAFQNIQIRRVIVSRLMGHAL